MEPNTPEPHHHSHHRKERWKVTPWQVIIFWDHARDTEVYFFRTEQGAKDYADSQKCAEGVRAIGVRHYDPARTAQQNATVEAWYKCEPRALTSGDLATIDLNKPDPEDVAQPPGGPGGGGGRGPGGPPEQKLPKLTPELGAKLDQLTATFKEIDQKLTAMYACAQPPFNGAWLPAPYTQADLVNALIGTPGTFSYPIVLSDLTLPMGQALSKSGVGALTKEVSPTGAFAMGVYYALPPCARPAPFKRRRSVPPPLESDKPVTDLQLFIEVLSGIQDAIAPLKELEEVPILGVPVSELVGTLDSLLGVAKDVAQLFTKDPRGPTLVNLAKDLLDLLTSLTDIQGDWEQAVGIIKDVITVAQAMVKIMKELGIEPYATPATP